MASVFYIHRIVQSFTSLWYAEAENLPIASYITYICF